MTHTEWIVTTDNDGYLEPVGELIRCCDCIYFLRIEDTGFGRCKIHHDGTHGRRMVQSIDYCAWAERKEQ